MKEAVKSSTGRALKPGSVVRVVAVPPSVVSQSPRDTRRLFKAMVGRRFKVRAIERGLVLLRLDVTRIGVPLIGGDAHIVFIEPEYVA
jgi:hypothetical protein